MKKQDQIRSLDNRGPDNRGLTVVQTGSGYSSTFPLKEK